MKTKTFDCVKMKEECQQAVLKKYGGLPPGDRERQMEADILASPILGDFYRRIFLAEAGKVRSRVAEGQAEYKAESGKN
ncbi:MAG TPA: hypothetical protein PKK36_10355 [Kiritimatiellia bacterium]|nr:hypothetical protein [Kiritimatiellia bacterium]HQQ05272.1 hypothetical protein [Kiritimatiellia bacterium]